MTPLAYIRIAGYALVLGVVFVGGYWACHTVAVVPLEKAAAEASARAAQEKVEFLEAAKVKQQEMQDAVDKANQQAQVDRRNRDAAAMSLNSVSAKLRQYIDRSIEDHGIGLPQATSGDASIASAKAIGLLAESLDGFGKQCAAEADRLGDEVRRIEASR